MGGGLQMGGFIFKWGVPHRGEIILMSKGGGGSKKIVGSGCPPPHYGKPRIMKFNAVTIDKVLFDAHG